MIRMRRREEQNTSGGDQAGEERANFRETKNAYKKVPPPNKDEGAKG